MALWSSPAFYAGAWPLGNGFEGPAHRNETELQVMKSGSFAAQIILLLGSGFATFDRVNLGIAPWSKQ